MPSITQGRLIDGKDLRYRLKMLIPVFLLSALIAVMLVAVAILCYGDDAFGLGYGSLFADEDAIVQCETCGQWFVDADGDGVCDYAGSGRHMGWGRNR